MKLISVEISVFLLVNFAWVTPCFAVGPEDAILQSAVEQTSSTQQAVQNIGPASHCGSENSSVLPTCQSLEVSKGIHPQKQKVGSGIGGSIYSVCLAQRASSSDCDWVVKEVPLRDNTEMQRFKKEADIFHLLGPTISPEVKEFYSCTDPDNRPIGKIIMKKMEGTLYDFLLRHPLERQHIETIFSKLHQAHKKGVAHLDLHGKNILFKKRSDGKFEFYLTDFGQSYLFDLSNPDDKNPRTINFRERAAPGTWSQQTQYDFESLLGDLQDKFNLRITVRTQKGVLQPASLPSMSKMNFSILREQVQKEVDQNEVDPDDNTVLVSIPGRGRFFYPADPELLSQEAGERLNALQQFPPLVIELPE